jgi:predicted dehydrogenase
MARKVKWGVLSTAKIGTEKVIPAMQKGKLVEIVGIASRDRATAQEAAKRLGIAKIYATYDELIHDPEIEAVYIPLPNHLHAPWTIKAVEAGKHVLCEKPLAVSAAEVRRLIRARDKAGVKVGEAFMVDTHPQWLKARELTRSSEFGNLRLITGQFAYNNRDPKNIRNIKEFGGGGIFDIGTYTIHGSRFVFGEEPKRVVALLETDPQMKIDRLTSVIMEFPSGHATFTCSTQIVPYQRMQFFGTKRRVEIEIPFNAPPDRKTRLFIDTGDLTGASLETIEFPVCNQYTIQGDEFSRAIIDDMPVAVGLEDSLANMQVIEAVFKSAESGKWVSI